MQLVLCLLFAAAFASTQQSSGCAVCQLVVSYVDNFVQDNATEAEIIQELDAICALLGGALEQECDAMVAQYVPQMIQWIVEGETPTAFCTQVGLCSFHKHHKDEVHILAKRDVQQGTCTVCELVVKYVEGYVQNNQTEQQIIQQLEQICDLLGPLSQTCDQFVEQYTPQLISWIVNGNSPQAFCASVGLCAAKQHKQHNSIHKRTVQQGGCSVCELLIQYIEGFLATNQTETQIIQQLDQICSLLGPLTQECDSFVALYVPQAIAWIEANENPQQFCTQVGLCAFAKPVLRKADVKKMIIKSGSTCSICETLAAMLEEYLGTSGAQHQIEAELAQLCGQLPAPFDAECNNIVAAYLPELIQWVVANENPQVLCTQLSLC